MYNVKEKVVCITTFFFIPLKGIVIITICTQPIFGLFIFCFMRWFLFLLWIMLLFLLFDPDSQQVDFDTPSLPFSTMLDPPPRLWADLHFVADLQSVTGQAVPGNGHTHARTHCLSLTHSLRLVKSVQIPAVNYECRGGGRLLFVRPAA